MRAGGESQAVVASLVDEANPASEHGGLDAVAVAREDAHEAVSADAAVHLPAEALAAAGRGTRVEEHELSGAHRVVVCGGVGVVLLAVVAHDFEGEGRAVPLPGLPHAAVARVGCDALHEVHVGRTTRPRIALHPIPELIATHPRPHPALRQPRHQQRHQPHRDVKLHLRLAHVVGLRVHHRRRQRLRGVHTRPSTTPTPRGRWLGTPASAAWASEGPRGATRARRVTSRKGHAVPRRGARPLCWTGRASSTPDRSGQALVCLASPRRAHEPER